MDCRSTWCHLKPTEASQVSEIEVSFKWSTEPPLAVLAHLVALSDGAKVGGAMAVSAQTKGEVRELVVIRVDRLGAKARCVVSDSGSVLLPTVVAQFLRPGDILCLPASVLEPEEQAEIYIQRPNARFDFLWAEIGHARLEPANGRDESSVEIDAKNAALGVTSVRLRCQAVRNYFFVGDRGQDFDRQPSFYELLQVDSCATLTELRVAFRLRTLELRAARCPIGKIQSLERAFNILAQPTLRKAYDRMLLDSGTATPFPYNGFGSLLVEGIRSRDGATFLASRILFFRPRQYVKSIHAFLRHCTFYEHLALYRDTRRRLEVSLDSCLLPISWEPSWNRWKHLLGVQAEIRSVFVQTGAYRYSRGTWVLKTWETALPSRIEVRLMDGVTEQIAKARNNYLRFGQFAVALEKVRVQLESTPVERDELRCMCSRLGIPADFDVSLITWKPDYEDVYYENLCRRARRMYLFRAEYIFDLEKIVVVETPQLGHATYLFSKHTSISEFLAVYRSTTREAILQNRDNVAERLGFLGRLIHQTKPDQWLRELSTRIDG